MTGQKERIAERHEVIVKLIEQGCTNKQIGSQLGMRQQTLWTYMKEHGLEYKRERRKSGLAEILV